MELVESPGPIIVCLDDEHDVASLVRCGVALAQLSNVPLLLAFLVVLPIQRPAGILSDKEEQRANMILDVAAEHATDSGLATTMEIWAVRSLAQAVERVAEDLLASAVIIGWQGTGPFRLFDIGRGLLKAARCPVIMVGWGTRRRTQSNWPPIWLAEMHSGPSG